MNNAAPPKYGMGARVRRMEDKALVTGAGRFTDDYTPEGTLRAVVLRSTTAHAKIAVSGLEEARARHAERSALSHESRRPRTALVGSATPSKVSAGSHI